MEKRLITAIALSILVIISFQHFFGTPPTKRAAEQPMTVAPVALQPEKEAAPQAPEERPVSEEEFTFESDRLVITFSNVGGAIKKLQLKDYKDASSRDMLVLASIRNPKNYILSMSDPSNVLPLSSSRYELTRKDNQIIYTLKLSGIEVVKKYIIPNSNYHIELRNIIKNVSGSQKDIGYQLITGSGLQETNVTDKRFVDVTSFINGKLAKFKHPKNDRIIYPGTVEWTALRSKYFSIIVKPFAPTQNEFYSADRSGMLTSGMTIQDVSMPPDSFVDQRFILYTGPNDPSVLAAGGYGLEESITYGFFGEISKAMLWVMKFFYRIVRSWGLSIILLAVFLNLLLFPLTIKSMKSMQKMQALHPQMEKLKAQFKDNPQKLNKEIMELYKKYKINPLSGCLPLILQMPVFIALYQALMRAIELRGNSFLWISDLSMPDAVSIPFKLPLIGNTLNVLVILMIIAMVVQQKLSTKFMGGAVTAEQKQQQKIMLIMMPVMFGFIFYNMPSGLVLYWFVNTILTVVEQYTISKYS
ncbi:MAG: membrane protein insertase YidC [Candidatus Omnitrophica bacterium]|nr:membrane protein insertase YidC [Candidatus Omnitrophota bacterium]